MEMQAAQVAYERLHRKRPWHDGTFTRWAERPSTKFPYRYDMGVTIWVSSEPTPDDAFTTEENARPSQLGGTVEASDDTPGGGGDQHDVDQDARPNARIGEET